MIYLVGLNGFEPNALRDTLQNLQRDSQRPLTLLDARSSQYSRTDAYRGNLNALLPEGATYQWDARLGGHPRDARLYRDDGRIDYRQLRAAPYFREAMDALIDAEPGRDLVVVCACRDAHTCHRVRAVGAELAARGIDAIELGPGLTRTSTIAILDGIQPPERRDFSERAIPTANRHAVPQNLPEPIVVATTPDPARALHQRIANVLSEAKPSPRPRGDILVLPITDNDVAKALIASLGASVVIDARKNPENTVDEAHPDHVRLPLSPNANLRVATLTGYATQHRPEHAAVVLCDAVDGETPYAHGLRLAGSVLAQVGQDVRYATRANDITAPRFAHDAAYYAITRELGAREQAPISAAPVKTPADLEREAREHAAVTWARNAAHNGERPSSAVSLTDFADEVRERFARAAQQAPDFAKEPLIYAEHESAVLFRAADENGPLINMYNHAPLEVPVQGNDGQVTPVAVQSSEALFQALFYGDLPQFQQHILRASHAMEAKQRAYLPPDQRPGADVKHDHTLAIVEEARVAFRDTHRAEIMRYVLKLKAAQNKDVRDLLLSTGEQHIVEKSGRDVFWGAISANGHLVGHNVLGRLWEEIRAELRENPNALDEIVPPQTDPPLKLLGRPLTTFRARERAQVAELTPTYHSPDREVMTWTGIGVSDRDGVGLLPREEQYAQDMAARLYRQNYTQNNGLATGSDLAWIKGVVREMRADAGDNMQKYEALALKHTACFIPTMGGYGQRAESLHLPVYVIDPQNPGHQWAYADAIKVHPAGSRLAEMARTSDKGYFTYQAHGRNMMLVKGERGTRPVEFVAYFGDMDTDGLPKGGTKTGVAAAENKHNVCFQRDDNRIPTFNCRTPEGRARFDAYVTGIERGDIRFGDGRAADGTRYIYPRDGFVGTGMTFTHENVPADLSYAMLNNATLDGLGTDLLPQSMHRAYAYRSTITNSVLDGDLDYLYAAKAVVDNAEIRPNALARGMTLQDARISNSMLAGDLRGSDFSRASIERSQLLGDLRGCIFNDTRMQDVTLGQTAEHVRNLDLSRAHMENVRWGEDALRTGRDKLGLRLTSEQQQVFDRQADELRARERAQQQTLVHAE